MGRTSRQDAYGRICESSADRFGSHHSRRQSTPNVRRVCDSVDVTVEAVPNDYQRLDPNLVVQTLERLQRRIVSRFPDRGLSKVAGQLATMAAQIAGSIDSSRRRCAGLVGSRGR